MLGNGTWLSKHPSVYAAISLGSSAARFRVVHSLASLGPVQFAQLIHPLAWVARRATLGVGAILYAGSRVNCDAVAQDFAFINMNCCVGHDAILGPYSTLAPGTCVAGSVHLGQGCDVGTNVTINPRISVGSWTRLGSGAVVVRDVPDNVVMVGVPAKAIRYLPDGWHTEV